jgi:hypothetical protein
MYIRFTTTAIDEISHKPRGLFQEAYLLLHSGDLSKEEWSQLRSALDWFENNLSEPPKKLKSSRAIYWFRSDAHKCIDKIWDMVHLLREHNRHIVIHKCRRLGNIAYRDKLQVAAYPSQLDDRIIES